MPEEHAGNELRIADIARRTGMSMRYWQRRAALGIFPALARCGSASARRTS